MRVHSVDDHAPQGDADDGKETRYHARPERRDAFGVGIRVLEGFIVEREALVMWFRQV